MIFRQQASSLPDRAVTTSQREGLLARIWKQGGLMSNVSRDWFVVMLHQNILKVIDI
jgi:hypothetical protein